MKIVLTVVLAAIILAAVWSGYRRGLILSAAQLAAIVVAFYGAALLAGQVSDRLLPVSQPVSRITTPASRGRIGWPRTPTPRRNTLSSASPPPVFPAGLGSAWRGRRSRCATRRSFLCARP